jgi:hypothetical protein
VTERERERERERESGRERERKRERELTFGDIKVEDLKRQCQELKERNELCL